MITGDGDDVVTTSFASDSGIPRDVVEERRTIFLLEGGADLVLPPLIGVGATSPDEIGWQSRSGESRLEVAMRALDGDRLIGFDSEDRILLPFEGFRIDPGLSEGGSQYDPALTNRDLVQYIGDPEGVPDPIRLRADMIQYDVEVTPLANRGGPDETQVEVMLHFPSVTGGEVRRVTSDGSESLAFTLDGTFAASCDDFGLDMVGVDLADEIPYVEVETLHEAFTTRSFVDGGVEDYQHTTRGLRSNPGEPFDAHFPYVDDPDKSLELALRYKPMEVTPQPDAYSLRQGETLSPNVLVNDTGRDVARAKAWEITLDEDFRGDIEFGVDPFTGLFDGSFDYVPDDDFLGVTGFEYAPRVPGRTLVPARAEINVLPRTPALADDEVRVSRTSGTVEVAELLANDDFFNTLRDTFESLIVFDRGTSGFDAVGVETVKRTNTSPTCDPARWTA